MLKWLDFFLKPLDNLGEFAEVYLYANKNEVLFIHPSHATCPPLGGHAALRNILAMSRVLYGEIQQPPLGGILDEP